MMLVLCILRGGSPTFFQYILYLDVVSQFRFLPLSHESDQKKYNKARRRLLTILLCVSNLLNIISCYQ